MSALGTLDRGIVSLLLNPIKASLGLSDVQVSVVIGAAFAISSMAFALPAGWAVDRFSRKALLGGAAVIWSSMTMLCGLSGNFVQLMLARAALGSSEALIQPGSFSLIRDAVPAERRGRAFSAFYVSIMLGTSSSFLLGGLLLGAVERSGVRSLPLVGPVHPWQLTLLIVGFVGLPVALLAAAMREPKRAFHRTAGLSGASYGDAVRFMLRQWRLYAPIFVAQISFTVVIAASGAWLAALMGRSYGLPPAKVGQMLGLGMLVFSTIGLVVAGRLLDFAESRRGLPGVTVVAFVLTAVFWVASALAPLAPNATWYLAAVTVAFLVSQGPNPGLAAIVSRVTPPHLMGKVTAIQMLTLALCAQSIGPTLVALLSEGVFSASGNRALANALCVVAFVGGLACVSAMAVLVRHASHLAKPQITPPGSDASELVAAGTSP